MGRPIQPLYVFGDYKPEKAHDGDAAFDLRAAHRATVPAFGMALIYCGFKIVIPENYVGLICSRSGMALNNAVFVLNAPGVIDPNYRGVVGVILMNLSDTPFEIYANNRIAQLLIIPNGGFRIISRSPSENLEPTERAEKGFGSTGI